MNLPEALWSYSVKTASFLNFLELAEELAKLTALFVDLNYARMGRDARRQAALVLINLTKAVKDEGSRPYLAGHRAWTAFRSCYECRESQQELLQAWLFSEEKKIATIKEDISCVDKDDDNGEQVSRKSQPEVLGGNLLLGDHLPQEETKIIFSVESGPFGNQGEDEGGQLPPQSEAPPVQRKRSLWKQCCWWA